MSDSTIEYDKAFLKAQMEFPPIVKDSSYELKGNTIYYASLKAIEQAIKPALHKYGIYISWPLEGNKVFVIFTHAESGQSKVSFSELSLAEADKNNEHKRKSAITYLRRANLEGLAGVVATDDDDAASTVPEIPLTADQEQRNKATELIRDYAKHIGVYEIMKAHHIKEYLELYGKQYRNIHSRDDAASFVNLNFLKYKDSP